MKKWIKLKLISLLCLSILSSSYVLAQENEEIAESDIFDIGKMWTFDYPPTQYLNETYGFSPDDEWFDDVRLSTLRIPGCTASFVSENGLIMTNNHCSPRHRRSVQLEDENLEETGFYAGSLQEERKAPNMYAEQLAFITDVTEEIINSMEKGKSDSEKLANKEDKIRELIEFYSKETGLKCQIVSLYNGGKYSIYGYRRYEDVRLVFLPEESIASFGGDFDNFTYPRYNLDCAFFRVYDDSGNPLTSANYFKFSSEDIQNDEVIFTVGNPGKTNRLYTVAQLEYNRDITYRNAAFRYDEYYNLLEEYKSEYPEKADEFERIRTRIGNGQKVYHYIYTGLMDPYLIARKRDFENKIKETVENNEDLSNKYGHVWESISNLRQELRPIDRKLAAYAPSRFLTTKYFTIAKDIIDFAKQMNLPEAERELKYKIGNIDSLRNSLYPDNIDVISENIKLQVLLDYIRLNLGDENELVIQLMKDYTGVDALNYLLDNTILDNKDEVLNLLDENPKEFLNSNDPIINFLLNTESDIEGLRKKRKEILDTESILVNLLGKLLFEIYGTEIPPDANFTLRISDGVLESFDYNGTVAIEKTTFYGMYDRYYGSDKSYPWNLPQRWQNPPVNLDLSTVYNFISTNDIVGGSSGSPVINKNAEVVGLAFDGNINSIAGDFIYLPEDNRMVSVAAQAIVEALDKVYKAERLVEELKTGKLAE